MTRSLSVVGILFVPAAGGNPISKSMTPRARSGVQGLESTPMTEKDKLLVGNGGHGGSSFTMLISSLVNNP